MYMYIDTILTIILRNTKRSDFDYLICRIKHIPLLLYSFFKFFYPQTISAYGFVRNVTNSIIKHFLMITNIKSTIDADCYSF